MLSKVERSNWVARWQCSWWAKLFFALADSFSCFSVFSVRPREAILEKLSIWYKVFSCLTPTWGSKGAFYYCCTLFKIFIFLSKNSTLISRENCRFFGWKTRENVVVLGFLAVDNFDFTRKIVQFFFWWKTR